MSASEKENKQTNNEQEHTRKFLEVSCRSRAKQRRRNVQKVCCTCRVAFSLIRPIVVFFYLSRCFCRLALHDFLFCLSKL